MNRLLWKYVILLFALAMLVPSVIAAEFSKAGSRADTGRVFQLDSLAKPRPISTQPKVKTRKNSSLIPIDSSNIIPKSFEYVLHDSTRIDPIVTLEQYQTSDERSNGDLWRQLPGIYPLNFGFFNQPTFPMTPSDPVDQHIEIFGRDNADPIRGWTPPELISTRGIVRMSGGPFAVGGNKITVEPLVARPRHPLMILDYRDGFYSLGNVDWRFYNPINIVDVWGVGVSVNQASGRYLGTGLSTKSYFLNYRHEPLGKPAVVVSARQYIDSTGIAHSSFYRTQNRYDLDAIISKGRPALPDTIRDSLGTIVRIDQPVHGRLLDWRIQGYWTSAQSRINPVYMDDGRRLGTIGKLSYKTGAGIASAFARIEELRALVAHAGHITQPLGEAGVEHRAGTRVQNTLQISALAARGFSVQPQGLASLKYRMDTLQSLTAWTARTVRLPTLLERTANLPDTKLEWSYDPLVYISEDPYPFVGNKSLQPVQQWRFGAQWQKSFAGVADLALYETTVHDANPIIHRLDLDTTGYKIVPENGKSLTYHMYGATLRSRPFGWGIANLVITSQQSERTVYFVPAMWGQLDLGASGHWKQNTFWWQGICRIRHIGAREFITTSGKMTKSAVTPVDFLVSLKIYSMRINWGVSNFFQSPYEAMPGYPAMHREEVWGVNWNIWD